jgi:hypothetical protein
MTELVADCFRSLLARLASTNASDKLLRGSDRSSLSSSDFNCSIHLSILCFGFFVDLLCPYDPLAIDRQ